MLGAILTLAVLGALMLCHVPGLALYVVQLAQRHRPGNVDIASILNVCRYRPRRLHRRAWWQIPGWAWVRRRGSARSWSAWVCC